MQIWTNLNLLKNNKFFFFFFFFLNNFKIRQKVGGDETDLRRRRIAACRLLLKGLYRELNFQETFFLVVCSACCLVSATDQVVDGWEIMMTGAPGSRLVP